MIQIFRQTFSCPLNFARCGVTVSTVPGCFCARLSVEHGHQQVSVRTIFFCYRYCSGMHEVWNLWAYISIHQWYPQLSTYVPQCRGNCFTESFIHRW